LSGIVLTSEKFLVSTGISALELSCSNGSISPCQKIHLP